jgi:hypothetical protein
MHIRNFLLRGDDPLLIDPKYAIASNPARPCYDLEGPERSGIPVPSQHLGQDNRNRLGVWWDAALPHEQTLARYFGRVAGNTSRAATGLA